MKDESAGDKCVDSYKYRLNLLPVDFTIFPLHFNFSGLNNAIEELEFFKKREID